MLAVPITKNALAESLPLKAIELPCPNPGNGEVRIRVLACGVCHTDLHELEGDIALPRLPVIPGHQVIGVVDRLGEGITAPSCGTLVGVCWLAHTCGRCRFCLSGRENLCESARFTGFHSDGGYAEFMTANSGFIFPLPDSLDPVAAAPLLCAGVIGYRSLCQAQTRPGCRLGLYGFGSSAHICLQIARYWQCQTAVFTRSPLHRQEAVALGADWTGSADDRPPWPLDSAVIFAPAGELVPKALSHLDRGGVLALAGIHMSTLPGFEYRLIYGERRLTSVTNCTRQDVADLLQLAAEIPLRTTVETFPLAAAGKALLALKQSHLRAAAVLKVS
ncbi:MAG: zinc-dependent alcohol dehydrogenase family protein [candidate division WOR-3 bacterium]